jgi:uncharacterized protein YmfQ (DUF2313 family)
MPSSTSTFGILLSCFAGELSRLEDDIVTLLTNAIPGLSEDLLLEWEADLGLPEDCFPLPQTLKERQDAAHAKYTANYAGLSEQFFIDLAFSLGATISISSGGTIGVPFRANGPINIEETRVGPFATPSDPDGRVWSTGRLHVWIVDIQDDQPSIDIIQCLFQKFKPAHTVVTFNIFPAP